jgi:hypothetical protein
VAEPGIDALRAQLGDGVPEALHRLEPEQLEDLAQAVAEARHRQTAALAAGGERALSMIPRLLRGPIRRIVG